jgi:hypothetical protein
MTFSSRVRAQSITLRQNAESEFDGGDSGSEYSYVSDDDAASDDEGAAALRAGSEEASQPPHALLRLQDMMWGLTHPSAAAALGGAAATDYADVRLSHSVVALGAALKVYTAGGWGAAQARETFV